MENLEVRNALSVCPKNCLETYVFISILFQPIIMPDAQNLFYLSRAGRNVPKLQMI